MMELVKKKLMAVEWVNGKPVVKEVEMIIDWTPNT